MRRSLLRFALLCATASAAACGTSSSSKPAASVNGHDISMAIYSKQFRYKEDITAESTGGIDVCKVNSMAGLCKQLKRTVLDSLIDNELVKEYAAQHHISVSSQDVAAQWSAVYKTKFHSDAAVLRIYAKGLGLTVADLKDMVRDDLLQQDVMYRVTQHMPQTTAAVRLARVVVRSNADVQRVRSEYRAGESIFKIAIALAHNSKGPCAQQGCGELGWLPNAFVPATQKAIMTAPPGTLVGPFASQQGLTLLLVEGHNPHYSMTSAQTLSMRQQLFGRWLAQRMGHSTVHRYVAT